VIGDLLAAAWTAADPLGGSLRERIQGCQLCCLGLEACFGLSLLGADTGQIGAHGQGMMTFTDVASVPSDPPGPFTDRLRLAVAAYLARFKGTSREHTESDLRCYLAWCAEHGLDPLAAQRPHLKLYIRWMQEIRRFKP
jgi:hypothetical protein